MKNKIYTISSAHLDTSWLWTQKETVQIYLPRTINENFKLFNEYPEYKFNFEGSYRYKLIEEYYPEWFKDIQKYVQKGKWNPCGSCYENGDTNIPSPEALIRNILYGNNFFKTKFNKKTNDIFLPDCFGFGRALPQIMSHCGLIGFSTGKLSWGSSIEPPAEFGKWYGLDNSFIYYSLKPGNYSTIFKEIRSKYTLDRIKENIETTNIPFTMLYYGTGDRGGSPHPTSMESIAKEFKENKNSDSEIIYGSVTEFFKDLKEIDEKQGNLSSFNKEFLMSTHGVGSYTSRAMSKRLNKKCENLLDISEKANSIVSILGLKEYPEDIFNFAWEKVLEHHFHDDITGTSFMECYKKNWNDYFLVLNHAKNEYISAMAIYEKYFSTENLNYPLMVFNPNQDETISTLSISIDLPYNFVKVIDLDNDVYPAIYKDGCLQFQAKVDGLTIKIFDVIEDKLPLKSSLTINKKQLENSRFKVLLDEDLNISSIYDKKFNKELLSSPIKYNLMMDYDSIQWPAWEIKYSDICREPFDYFKGGVVSIIEDSPSKISLQIIKTFNKSTLKEIISLEKDSDRIDVYNELIWHEDCTNLKISFPLSINSDHGTYDIGISKYDRPNNTEKLYEVPCQKFAKIEENDFGITIITDSKQGFDKPKDNELRLTIVHSPFSNYRYECSQHLLDFGKNIFSYSITSSLINEDNSIEEAEKFTKPMNVFKMQKHSGTLNNNFNLLKLSNNNARIMCFKKALNDNKYVLRIVDYYGQSLNDVCVNFNNKIKNVYLIKGDEEIIEKVDSSSNSFMFNLNKHEIKSFLIEFDEALIKKEDYEFVELNFDKIGITSNNNRRLSTLKNKISLPLELIPNEVINTSGIKFKLKLDGKNAIQFNDQVIDLNRKYQYIYLLILNQGKDKEILINNKKIFVQNSFEDIGRWDMYGLREFGYTKKIPQAFTFTHFHKFNKDQILSNLYLYSVKIKIDTDTLILNKNPNISLFAIAYSNIDNEIECDNSLIDQLDKRKFNYKLTKDEIKYNIEPLNERFKDIFINRRKTKYVDWWGGHCYQSPSDFYQLETEKRNNERRKKINI